MNKPAADMFKQRFVEAMQLHVQGKLDAARQIYETLLHESPGQPDILHALGTIALQMQQWQKAIDYFKQAPKQPRHLLPLARAYLQSGDKEQAVGVLAKLLTVEHSHEEGQVMLHDICLPDAKAHGVKGSLIDQLIAKNPKAPGLYSVGIRLCRTLEEVVYRLTYFEALYRVGARSEPFCVEYGAMLRNNGQFERCLKLCNEWLKDYPDSLNLLRLRGGMYMSLGEHAKALKDWMQVSERTPDDPQARASVGIIKLMMSNLTEGFEEYESTRDRVITLGNFKVPIPEWRGEPLKGKRLILWSSEGLGDTIMFASLLPWVMEQGAEITLALFPRLAELFMRSFPAAKLVPFEPETLAKRVNEFDFQIAFSQLMARLLPHYTPAEHPPYLKADAARAEILRKKYRKMFPFKKLVGISWFTKNADTFSQRNITLTEWQPIFTLPNVQVISLQYGASPAEIEAINQKFPGAIHVDPEIDPYGDTDALAAQMLALDEVVSVQNTTVHLGGALGVPTTILLSAASDWRWGMKQTGNRWYQSVTIERQQKLMDWKPVLMRVCERLAS